MKSDNNRTITCNDLGDRIGNGMIALTVMVGIVLVGYWACGRFVTTSASINVNSHAPAFIGLPMFAAFSIVIVCGARALDPRSHIEILGLRVEGAPAAVLSWTLVFSALVIALRALW